MDQNMIMRTEAKDVVAMLDLADACYDGNDGDENRYKAFELYQNVLQFDPDNARAINNLGNCYKNGVGVEKNMVKAMEYYRQSAEMGYASAQYNLAYNLKNKNDPECLIWYQKAYENGDIDAPYEMAVIYEMGEIVSANNKKAVEYYEYAVNMGNIYAMVNLADMHLKGTGTPLNIEKGLELLQRAAESDNPFALFRLGSYYFQGDSYVPQDREKAIGYWQRGSEAGGSECSYILAQLYKVGEGVPKDSAIAIEYFEKAMHQGSVDAALNLGHAYDDGIAGQDYTKAVECYEKAFTEGSADGAYFLGLMYEIGKGVPQDEVRALELYTYASDNNHACATAKVGIFYHDGLGTEKDEAKSVEYFEKAKAMGDPEVNNMIEYIYTRNADGNGIDPKKSFEYNLKLANEGDTEAQYKVFEAYQKGEGIEADFDTALIWLRKAADGNHVISQAVLGYIELSSGNPESGVKYWEKASANGHLMTMHDLAELYLNGDQGVPMNKPRAIELLKEAADAGYAKAQLTLGICYMIGNGIEQNEYEAVNLFTMAAEQGEAEAEKNLGVSYRDGLGVEINMALATQWFEKAAARGNMQSMEALADIYAEGEGVPIDYNKAETLYKKVIENGESIYLDDAIYNLAQLYTLQLNDYNKAFPFWKQSAERGNANAKYILGMIYSNGWGATKDINQALYWMRQAAADGVKDAHERVQLLEKEMQNTNRYSNNNQNHVSQKSGGCYIATAVYGSYDCPEVWTLRRFRDHVLAETWYGRAFIKVYYTISPTLVRWFGGTEWFNHIWRSMLDRMVNVLQSKGIENTHYKDRQ